MKIVPLVCLILLAVATSALAAAPSRPKLLGTTPKETSAQQIATDGLDTGNAEAAATNLPPDEYTRGRIISITPTGYQIKLDSGKESGQTVTVKTEDVELANGTGELKVGAAVVVVKSWEDGGMPSYHLLDDYRLPALAIIFAIFLAAVTVIGGWRGVTSVIGLAATVGVIVGYIVPTIVHGGDALNTCLIGTFVIAAASLYLAHGFNRRTTVALSSTVLALGFSARLASNWVSLTRLFGTGSEEAMYLKNNGFDGLDLRGLLLGGIMLGVLGILDDITTAQAAVVEELKRANPSLGWRELFRRSLSVGREHIASLVNTLFLAYAGIGLPLFLLLVASKDQPLWLTLNSEMIADEVVRTLVGSVCLVLAVPLTGVIAAVYYGRPGVKLTDQAPPGHQHG